MQTLRNQALRKFRQTKLPKHYEYYKQIGNYTAAAAIRSEKKNYEQNFKTSSFVYR